VRKADAIAIDANKRRSAVGELDRLDFHTAEATAEEDFRHRSSIRFARRNDETARRKQQV
jgi:hypothetical protein